MKLSIQRKVLLSIYKTNWRNLNKNGKENITNCNNLQMLHFQRKVDKNRNKKEKFTILNNKSETIDQKSISFKLKPFNFLQQGLMMVILPSKFKDLLEKSHKCKYNLKKWEIDTKLKPQKYQSWAKLHQNLSKLMATWKHRFPD